MPTIRGQQFSPTFLSQEWHLYWKQASITDVFPTGSNNIGTEALGLQLTSVGVGGFGEWDLEDWRWEDHSLSEMSLELAYPSLVSVRTEIIQNVIGTIVKPTFLMSPTSQGVYANWVDKYKVLWTVLKNSVAVTLLHPPLQLPLLLQVLRWSPPLPWLLHHHSYCCSELTPTTVAIQITSLLFPVPYHCHYHCHDYWHIIVVDTTVITILLVLWLFLWSQLFLLLLLLTNSATITLISNTTVIAITTTVTTITITTTTINVQARQMVPF